MDWKREFRNRFINIGYLMYEIGDTAVQRGKNDVFKKMVPDQLDKHMKK